MYIRYMYIQLMEFRLRPLGFMEFLYQSNSHHAVKKMKWIKNLKLKKYRRKWNNVAKYKDKSTNPHPLIQRAAFANWPNLIQTQINTQP